MNSRLANQTHQQKSTAKHSGSGFLQRKSNCDDNTLQRASLLPLSRKNKDQKEIPPIVHEVLRSPGQPLDTTSRAFFGARMGHDFSKIRIHTNKLAMESANALGAQAYTVMPNIIFGSGQYAPYTRKGQRLLAHELTHVVQQAFGSSKSYTILEHEAAIAEQGVFPAIHYQNSHISPKIQLQMSPDCATRLLIVIEEDESRASFTLFRDEGDPLSASGSARGLGTGEYRVVYDATAQAMTILSSDLMEIPETSLATIHMPDESHIIRLLRAVEQPIPMEVRIGTVTGGAPVSGETTESADSERLRQAIDELPEHVRDILFRDEGRHQLSPPYYAMVLRVGQKLASMSAVELADWRSRTTAMTQDWASFEASIDAYLATEAERYREQIEIARTAARLSGLEELYELRVQLRDVERQSPVRSGRGVVDPYIIRRRRELLRRVQEALGQAGFSSMAEFDAAIAAWRTSFERETVRVSDVLLDRFDHTLFLFQRRYADPAQATALAEAIAASGAQHHFEFSASQRARAVALSDPEGGLAENWQSMYLERIAGEARARGEAAMQNISADHPILAIPDFPRERLARAPSGEVQSILLDYITEHRESVHSTRGSIHSDTDLIYKLPPLLEASKQAQGITPNSIYERIIRDHISIQGLTALVGGIALAIITVALTIATFGTGTLAAAAGVAAFGLSAWQAVDAFQDYMRETIAAEAQLLSEEEVSSVAWLVIAVVGAAADLGAAAAAIRAIRPAALALNELGDMSALGAFRQEVNELVGVSSRIKNAMNRAAEAEAAQWAAIRTIGFRANEIFSASTETGVRLMLIAWYRARQGFLRFEQFLSELRRVNIISDVLDPSERTALLCMHEEALRRLTEGFLDPSSLSSELRAALSSTEIDDAAAFGRLLGLDDDAAAEVLEIQARVAREAGDPDALSPEALRTAMRRASGRISETAPTGSAAGEIAEVIEEQTTPPGRSLTYAPSHTAEEATHIGEEIISSGGRLDWMERHHSVYVYLLNAIAAHRSGRSISSVAAPNRRAFRLIVDELFGQELVNMERMVHVDLHRAVNDVLDNMLEPQRVAALVVRNPHIASFGPGRRVVQLQGTPGMMQRLEIYTARDLVNILERAYLRVFAEHPGLVSDEVIEEILQQIHRVRQAL